MQVKEMMEFVTQCIWDRQRYFRAVKSHFLVFLLKSFSDFTLVA